MSVINDAQTNRVCTLSIHSYFCLNTAQYIHVVENSECFITDVRVCWRICKDQWCSHGYQTLQTACSYRGTADGIVNSE